MFGDDLVDPVTSGVDERSTLAAPAGGTATSAATTSAARLLL